MVPDNLPATHALASAVAWSPGTNGEQPNNLPPPRPATNQPGPKPYYSNPTALPSSLARFTTRLAGTHLTLHSQQCWQVVGLPFGPANLVLGLPKNSPLTALLNGAILQLRGNGVVDQLKRRWVDDLDQCTSAASQVPALFDHTAQRQTNDPDPQTLHTHSPLHQSGLHGRP